MYCHLRPPDAMPLLTLNVLGPRDPILIVAFTITMRHHLVRLASAPFTSFRLLNADLRVRYLATKQNAEFTDGGYISGPILAVCGPKFTKFWDTVGTPCAFQYHARLSMACFVEKTFAIKSRSR